jgi:hypothetical protein
MKNYLRVVFALAVIFVLCHPAHAAITGTISGTVTDPTGAAVPGVTVVALNEDTGVKVQVMTDGRGFYSFTALNVGRYTVSTAQQGFEGFHETGIKVDANSSI